MSREQDPHQLIRAYLFGAAQQLGSQTNLVCDLEMLQQHHLDPAMKRSIPEDDKRDEHQKSHKNK